MDKNLSIDPRIKIKIVPDGEIHIVFTWTKDDLETFARAFLASQEPGNENEKYAALFRLRTKEGVDYVLDELHKARQALWGKE